MDENPPQPFLIREGGPKKSPQIKGDLGFFWKQAIYGIFVSNNPLENCDQCGNGDD